MKKILLLLTIIIMVSACSTQPKNAQDPQAGLQKFESRDDVVSFLQKNLDEQTTFFGGMRTMAFDMVAESAPMAAMADGGAGKSAESFSTTNIQVQGVDEADMVKNDGKYIYLVNGQQVIIMDAYPADEAAIIAKIDVKGYPSNIYINDDKLIIFSSDNDESYGFAAYDIMPRRMYKQIVRVSIYDVSDHDDPELAEEYEANGYLTTSRMIGDYVYMVIQESVNFYQGYVDLPILRTSSRVIAPDIYYYDMPDRGYNFNTVASFNVHSKDSLQAESFMMGYMGTVYASTDHLYISHQKYVPYIGSYDEEVFEEIVLPLIPSTYRSKIKDIMQSTDSRREQWAKISPVLEEMYNNMDEDDKEDFIADVQKRMEQYEIEMEKERRKTVIHKIALDNGDIDYVGKNEVPGYFLNQFSLDEHDGYLRVASTFNSWVQGKSIEYNNVYVLDSGMDIVGEIEEIAPNERIYSTRFMGDKLYMVTFKKVDPLFVIDLSDPENPKILGKLKIPGYSDYLHPLDENHIIGIGKDTVEAEGFNRDFAWYQGIKLAIFDVTDVENPKQLHVELIGDRGTDSEALHEHKAFLFDAQKELMVLPITLAEIKGEKTQDNQYGDYTFQGAYVYHVTKEEGFKLIGRVTHYEDSSIFEKSGFYFRGDRSIRRSLYMDNVLYTISQAAVKMNDLDDLDEINMVDLPYEERIYPVMYEDVVW